MSFCTACPQCRSVFQVPASLEGQRVRCKGCQQVFVIAKVQVPVEGDIPSVIPADPNDFQLAEAAAQPVPPPAHVVVPPPTQRPVPHRPPHRPARKNISAASLLLGVIVVGGSLALLAAVAVAIGVFLTSLSNDSSRSERTVPKPEVIPPHIFMPGGPENGGDLWDLDPDSLGPGDEEGPGQPGPSLSYVAPELDETGDGPQTFHPDVIIPSGTSGGGKPAQPAADGSLPPDVLARVKRATAYLRVTRPGSMGPSGSGTGFFTLEPGLVVTNAHVLGMNAPRSEKPALVEVFVNSGESGERKLRGDVLMADPVNDLAIIKVNDSALPDPLPVISAKTLQETQLLFAFGFPYGESLNKRVSVSKCPVMSFVTEQGRLIRIQMNGELNPGNSGGPIVDAAGRVVGVAVSIRLQNQLMNSGISFAVPADFVFKTISGSIERCTLGQPVANASGVGVPVVLEIRDPLKRVASVGVEYWTSDATGPQPAPPTAPPSNARGLQKRRATLNYVNGRATGLLNLAPAELGKTQWIRPLITTRGGKTLETDGFAYLPPPPVQPKVVRFGTDGGKATPSTIHLTSRAGIKGQAVDVHTPPVVLALGAKAEELAPAVNREGQPLAQLQFLDFQFGVRKSDVVLPRSLLRHFLGSRGTQPGTEQPGDDYSRLPDGTRQVAAAFTPSIHQLLDSLTVPVPSGELVPNHQWRHEKVFPVDVIGGANTPPVKITYTCLGTRSRDGREVAAIALEGLIGSQREPEGSLHGLAWVDVFSGQTTLVRARMSLNTESTMQGRPVPLNGTLDLKLQRTLRVDAVPVEKQ